MPQRKLQFNVVRDDGAQAMTEFAIVIPVVLLFFLAMLQYFSVVQASQLGNYAAYCAARVYAVQGPVCKHINGNDNDAKDKAKKAAALALAPIARLVPGEVAIKGTSLGSLSGLLPAGTPDFLQGVAKFAEGYAVAYYVRLNSSLGGGDFKIETSGSQVNVSINYPQPVYLPGLAELWNLVQGENIFTSLKPLREDLGGLPGAYATYQEVRDLFESLGVSLPDSPVTFFPYVNVRSKCSMGLEDWGSKEEYRPRKHGTVKDAGPDPEDQGKIDDAQKSQQAAQAYNDAVANETSKCSAWNAARAKLQQAQTKYDNTPDEPVDKKQQALDELNEAKAEEEAAHNAYNSARQNRRNKQEALEAITGESYGDLNCDN